jgi:hypothetical protein
VPDISAAGAADAETKAADVLAVLAEHEDGKQLAQAGQVVWVYYCSKGPRAFVCLFLKRKEYMMT